MKIPMLTIWIITASVHNAGAQQLETSSGENPAGMTSLSILSSPDSAQVTIDSVRAGVTPLLIDSLCPGRHVLRLSGRDPDNWLENPVVDTVFVSRGERKTLRYAFDGRYALSSMPSGAAVIIGETPAGSTPMILMVPPGGGMAPVSLRLAGYETAGVNLAQASRGALMVQLHRIWSPDSGRGFSGISMTSAKRSPSRLYVSAFGAIVAGAAAAFFKIQADNKNDLYLLTGDPAVWSQVRKYDTISALSLTLAQIGMGLFAYFLLSE